MADAETGALQRELDRQATRQRDSDHRHKNTLQLISSIVLLQGRRSADETARHALRAVLQRVSAVSVADRHVAWTDGSEAVELAALVREVASDLAKSAGREGVALELDLEPVTAPGRVAAPVALLASEAVGNALRHAFPGDRPGRVQVSLRRTTAGFDLRVADDGVGLADGAPPTGFGFSVLQLMAQQLRGRLETDATQPGLRLAVSVPMDTQASPRP
jgi:two-component sensor histidine kinase